MTRFDLPNRGGKSDKKSNNKNAVTSRNATIIDFDGTVSGKKISVSLWIYKNKWVFLIRGSIVFFPHISLQAFVHGMVHGFLYHGNGIYHDNVFLSVNSIKKLFKITLTIAYKCIKLLLLSSFIWNFHKNKNNCITWDNT